NIPDTNFFIESTSFIICYIHYGTKEKKRLVLRLFVNLCKKSLKMFTKCFIINLPYEFTKFYFVCFHHKSKLRFFKLYRINKHNFTNQRSVFYDNFSTRRSRLYRFARCRPASSKGVSSSCGR